MTNPNEQTASTPGSTLSSQLSSDHRLEPEDVTMEETQAPSPTVDNTPTKTWVDVTPESVVEQPSRALVKRAMVKDLPKFKILNDDMKDSEDAFVSVNQYFKAFERTFRMQNVDLEHNWRDNLANVIGIDHADWYSDTIEQNMGISYAKAKAMIMDHIESPAKAINMFNKLVNLRQKTGEPAADFGKRFIRAAHAAQCADSNFLARLYMNSLQPYLNLSVRTSLSSHLGISFLHRLKSFRQVEALISGLEVHVSEDPFVASMNKASKKNHHESKIKGGERSPSRSANRTCMYCNKPWEKGHRCSEFLEAKKAKSNQGTTTQHKLSNNQVRTIKMDHLIEEWTNFDMKNSEEDEAIDNAIAVSEDNDIRKCRSIKQDFNNLVTKNPFSLYTPLLIQKIRAIGLVDTGSELSVISKKFILSNKIPFVTNNHNAILKLAGKNNTINRVGRTEPIEISYNGKISTHTFEIIEFDDSDQTDAILGYEILPKLGIALTGVAHNFDDAVVFDDSINDEVIPNNSPAGSIEDQRHFIEEIKPLLDANQLIPKHSFCTVPESVIHLNTVEGEVVNIPQYPIPYKLRPKIQEQIEIWLANGTIEKAPVNTKWKSPLTLAAKKDSQGNKSDTNKRVCLDTRALNNILLDDDVQSLPHIPDIFHKLAGYSVFTTFDAFSAFHRFEIFGPHRVKTSWTSPIDGTQYCFKGSPYGIKFLSNVYQRVMTRLFNDEYEYVDPSENKGSTPRRRNPLKNHIAFFVDDLVCFSSDLTQHLVHVKEVIRILNKVNLILNIDKCHFAQKSINLLGFSVSAQGKTIDTRKISNIESWPRPKTGTDVQRFLGLVNYMRDHIPKASALMAPLDRIRNAKVITEKEWTPIMETHFQAIKKVLVSNIVLSPPDLNHPYTVYTDSSSYGIGCVLCQEYNVEEVDSDKRALQPSSTPPTNNDNQSKKLVNIGINTKPPVKKIVKYIGFMARSLSSSERNYSTTKRELLAIIFALQKFRKFLWGTQFNVMCDHRALTYIHTQKHANSMMLNWFDYLQDFTFNVIYLPGIDNVLADRLSRLFPPLDHNLGEDMLDKNNKMTYKRKNIKFKKINGQIRAIKRDTTNKLSVKHVEYKHGDYLTPPESERKALLLRAHVFGHFGAESIVKSLHNDGLHWPNLAVDAVELVKGCTSCQKHNITKRGFQPLRPIYSYIPGDHWAIDLAELPLSANGYKYLLVMVDICTRFCILRCMKDKRATTMAKHLVQVFSDFGYPSKISNDNGSENANIITQTLCETMNIDQRLITSYNAASNGSAERFVQSSKLAIAKAVEGAGHEWDLYVPGVQLALNNKVSKRLNTPPFNLMFARRMNAFVDYRESDKKMKSVMSYEELIKRIDHMNEIVFPAINDKTDKYVANMRDKFDEYKNVVKDYPSGTHVMVRIPTLKGSLMPSYEGPYTIIRKTKGGSYVLQNETGVLMDRDYAPRELKVVNKNNIEDDDEAFEIEDILEHKGSGKNTEYKIRWKGYSHEHDLWVTPDLITHESTIQKYWRRRLGKDYKPYKNSKTKSFTDTLKSNKKGTLQKIDKLLVPLQDNINDNSNVKTAIRGRKRKNINNKPNQQASSHDATTHNAASKQHSKRHRANTE
ncbi:hypothetical protein G6F42_012503 [Rhizopus arrhizus]|nr:hypothetical protein G6F42_012503 [Rhizopus arrhizus]